MVHFCHNGSRGDIIYSLPTAYSFGENEITYNLRYTRWVEYAKDLLELQPTIKIVRTIEDFKKYCSIIPKDKPEQWFSLNGFRPIALRKTNQHLVVSHLESLGKEYDYSKPWLVNIEPNHRADIVLHRSTKYHDINNIEWSLLKEYENKCIFVGFRNEYKAFVSEFGFQPEFHIPNNGLDTARIIKGGKFFVGNQSSPFSLAEGMKHPRFLEIFSQLDNCRPSGNDGHIKLTKELIEYYLER